MHIPGPVRFIDIGCSKGGSIRWASGALGGVGVGIDISPEKVRQTLDLGFDAHIADARSIPRELGRFNYGFFSNILEHLPNAEYGADCVRGVWQVVDDFVAITGPNFEHEAYLRQRGFKRYFSDWKGHTWHHSVAELTTILASLSPVSAVICEVDPIVDSGHHVILPLAAKPDQGSYDPKLHGIKDHQKFPERKVHASVFAVAAKRETVDIGSILLALSGSKIRFSAGFSTRLT